MLHIWVAYHYLCLCSCHLSNSPAISIQPSILTNPTGRHWGQSPHWICPSVSLWNLLKGAGTSSSSWETNPRNMSRFLLYPGSHRGHPTPAARKQGVNHELNGSVVLQPTRGSERSFLSLSVMILTFSFFSASKQIGSERR